VIVVDIEFSIKNSSQLTWQVNCSQKGLLESRAKSFSEELNYKFHSQANQHLRSFCLLA
jgi:hypothetical protein